MIQIDMEMPKNCKECPFEKFGDCYGGKAKYIMDIEDYVEAEIRHPQCPLVEVNDKTSLRRCPFCGSEAKLLVCDLGVSVTCPNCGCCTDSKKDDYLGLQHWIKSTETATERVIKAWNRRPNNG